MTRTIIPFNPVCRPNAHAKRLPRSGFVQVAFPPGIYRLLATDSNSDENCVSSPVCTGAIVIAGYLDRFEEINRGQRMSPICPQTERGVRG